MTVHTRAAQQAVAADAHQFVPIALWNTLATCVCVSASDGPTARSQPEPQESPDNEGLYK